MILPTEAEPVRLVCGDAMEVLPSLPESLKVVTDPPYGIKFVKKDTGRGTRGLPSCRRNAGPIVGDDSPFDPLPLLRWPCVMFGPNHFYDRLPAGGMFHAWDKRAHSSLDDSFSDVEFVWTSWPCKSRIVSHLWKGVLQATEKGKPKYHVSQKPVEVMVQLLKWFTDPGDTVLDPYMGSGSTGVACVQTGRRFIGIELDPGHFQTATNRINAALGVGGLFAPTAPVAADLFDRT